jgi:hypothetical protein
MIIETIAICRSLTDIANLIIRTLEKATALVGLLIENSILKASTHIEGTSLIATIHHIVVATQRTLETESLIFSLSLQCPFISMEEFLKLEIVEFFKTK